MSIPNFSRQEDPLAWQQKWLEEELMQLESSSSDSSGSGSSSRKNKKKTDDSDEKESMEMMKEITIVVNEGCNHVDNNTNTSLTLIETVDGSSEDDDDDDDDDSEYDTDTDDEDEDDDEESMKLLEALMMEEEVRVRRSYTSLPDLLQQQLMMEQQKQHLGKKMTGRNTQGNGKDKKHKHHDQQEDDTQRQLRRHSHKDQLSAADSGALRLTSSMTDLSYAIQQIEQRRARSTECVQDPTWNMPAVAAAKVSTGLYSDGMSRSVGALEENSTRNQLPSSSTYTSMAKSLTKSPKRTCDTDDLSPMSSDRVVMKPEDCLKEILNKGKGQGKDVYEMVDAATAPDGFYVPQTPKDFDDFSNDISAAVRNGDIKALKAHLKSGKSPHCCNKFKESIVHTICRRGNDKLLSCILHFEEKHDEEESQAAMTRRRRRNAPRSLRVVDDQNRTPLHDAAWTHKPNFRLIKLIIYACPDLLLVKDQRGFTPLAYVGRNQWKDWCDFLYENQDLLTPILLPPTTVA